MPKALTIENINDEINKENYSCVEYNLKSKKFTYICSLGHRGSTRLDHWRRGVRCSTCSGNKKLTFEQVKYKIESDGYTLLSTEYINSESYLFVRCPEGHEYEVKYNNWVTGYRCAKCFYIKNSGKGNPNYQGGVTKTNLPLYNTFASKLENYQKVYKINKNNLELLGVECAHCKKVFVPTRYSVSMRLLAINGTHTGDSNLYCSSNCKNNCSTYKQVKYYKYNKPNKNNRIDQENWAKLIKERDSYVCQKCGIKEDIMYAHHIDPIILNPIESLDLDNGLTLCKKCHKEVHSELGCKYSELRC